MRVRIQSIHLVGTDRVVRFQPGLNIITGPIASGKTTLMRLCHGLFGTGLENFPPEVKRNVVAIGGQLLLGDHEFTVVRPFVTTKTAKVDVSGLDSTLRLPALVLDETAAYTYGQWLLRTLGLPDLRVPSAPTRPESDPTPLSINDFFLYCVLSQETIDNSVCGHRDTFKNIKRKYVFEVLYGIYNTEIFKVQERLHQVNAQLSQLSTQVSSFEKVLSGTPWENRAELTAQLEAAKRDLTNLESEVIVATRRVESPSNVQMLRKQVLALDSRAADLSASLEREDNSVQQLERLIRQLESQSKRLTKTIIAKTYLTDFEFILCPRCGAGIEETRADEDVCNLCLQPPAPKLDRKDFINEQDRVSAQIGETRELVEAHQESVKLLHQELHDMAQQRDQIGHELDFRMQTFISDAAEKIANTASKRPAAIARVNRLQDYLQLYERLDTILSGRARLEEEKNELEGTVELLKTRQDVSERRIRKLEANFEDSLRTLAVPRFSSTPRSGIDRFTYMPTIDGRKFDDLSSQGLQVLVNVAHAVAHQRTAIDLGLPLPNILLIDGLTTNVGQEGSDLERVHNAYQCLMALADELGDTVQIIVADGNIPLEAEKFVRLRLSEEDRLIPLPDGVD